MFSRKKTQPLGNNITIGVKRKQTKL